ncbi:diguanylate cyclase [Lactiplantibacillus garii]|uniref:Diguanylate cyclase n=1 Tax=Lactiplantibacillus garii TaxID=2306423 RepID=A0A3R8J6D8_9LACO|nr:diguanylate cyclase [Lactiplantibacillus garii]RRK09953.1 diguanylate cyclase [Lactiplantibacillus garii]
MAAITIFGKGNMGQAIGGNFEAAGNQVTYVGSHDQVPALGAIIVLAVPYAAAVSITESHTDEFAGKVVVDVTNPLNFDTWDELVVPADSSAAAILADKAPQAKVVKAFNTTFAGTLAAKQIGNDHPTTVLMAADDADAKKALADALDGSGLVTMDAGSLKRAREMEAFGFLQMTLAASEQIGWTGGFGIFK